MKKKVVLGVITLVALSLGACGNKTVVDQTKAGNSDVAFGQAARTSHACAWYVTKSKALPQSNTPLQAIVITQNGRALAFRVPGSFTLRAATKLSIRQLRQKGPTLARQDFTQKRRTLIALTRRELATEEQNLRRNQDATVVSFATIKTDKRLIRSYQRQLKKLQETKFKQPRALRFSVTVIRKNRENQERIKVRTYDFVEAVTRTNNQTFRYQKTRHNIFTVPYTHTSEKTVRVGRATLGYYQNSHGDYSDYALTKLKTPNTKVKFDS